MTVDKSVSRAASDTSPISSSVSLVRCRCNAYRVGSLTTECDHLCTVVFPVRVGLVPIPTMRPSPTLTFVKRNTGLIRDTVFVLSIQFVNFMVLHPQSCGTSTDEEPEQSESHLLRWTLEVCNLVFIVAIQSACSVGTGNCGLA